MKSDRDKIRVVLICAVGIILLSLIFVGTEPWTAFTITIILLTLILVIGGASPQIPSVVRAIAEVFARLFLH